MTWIVAAFSTSIRVSCRGMTWIVPAFSTSIRVSCSENKVGIE